MGYKYTTTFTYKDKRYYVRANTKKELNEKLEAKKIEVQSTNSYDNMTVSEWAYFCVDKYKVNLKENTMDKYLSKLKHCVLEKIGNMKVKNVRSIDCQELLNMYQGYAKSYINEIYQLLTFIFGKAIDNDLIEKDPTRNLTKPNGTKYKRRAITEEEREALYYAVSMNPKLLPFRVMLEAGLRPSESLNLKISDLLIVDDVPILNVNGTKSANAKRIVPISNELFNTLLEAKNDDISEYLFLTDNHTKHNEKSYQRLTKALYRAMDIYMGATVYRNEITKTKLSKDFCPYCLRHTFATDLIRNTELSLPIISKLLGHASITTTHDIYINLTSSDIIKNANQMLHQMLQNQCNTLCHKETDRATNVKVGGSSPSWRTK